MNLTTEQFPTFTTERCLLRKIVASDQQKIFEGLSHPEVIRYYGVSFNSFDATTEQMKFYDDLLENETGIWWAVCLLNSGEFIGACGLNNWNKEHRKAEIGFWLMPSSQGKGYMKEVVPHVVKYGFDNMNLHRIEAVVESENTSSSGLLKKLEFAYEGTHKECEIKNGSFIDLDYFARLAH
jgi:ribosomal-protein-alanine N-acetyltransferase